MEGKDLEVVPVEWPAPLPDLIITPIVVEPIVEDNWWNKIPCAFDNLPPGVYGLVCQCPKCTPYCTG
jgi:hypothetical protein